MISKVAAEPKTKLLPVSNKATLKQVKLLFVPLVIHLVWYILKQLFISVSVKVVDIYLAASRLGIYPPLFTSTSVNKSIIVNSRISIYHGGGVIVIINHKLKFFLRKRDIK